jgi:hypothetical protein
VREAVRRLGAQGALRLVERSKAGHVMEVRLPQEIRAAKLHRIEEGAVGRAAVNIEEADFLQDGTLRKTIHAREGGQCFSCLRRITPAVQCLDHVVPCAQLGRNSHRNLVSSCIARQLTEGGKGGEDFLRRLYCERRLSAAELTGRLRALDALASGKLPPPLDCARQASAQLEIRK